MLAATVPGVPLPPRAQASEPLRRFLQVARSAGLRVSAAEGIDAARAVDVVGFSDRTLLKNTLGLVLAKTLDEKAIYDETFELFFQREDLSAANKPADKAPPPSQDVTNKAAAGANSEDPSSEPTLTEMIEREDRVALATRIESTARAVGIEKIRLLTQRNLYTRQILDRMGLRELEQRLEEMRARGTPEDDARAQAFAQRIERLWDTARDFVERAMQLYAKGETEQFRERMLKTTKLENIDHNQHERMRVLVRKMAKRLATRYATKRRKRQRGQLDIRRTLRRNMGWGGVPFVTVWKQRSIEKPRVLVLCDVSGSVAWVAHFLLLFIYALTEVLSDIRSFVFSGTMVEVSDLLERYTIEDAIERVMATEGFGTSNYGHAFEGFEDGWMEYVTSKTSIVVLGDARGNGNDPRVDIVDRLAQRAKRVIWLNPESRSSWGSGDSDMYRYAPFCNLVRVCATLNDMERVITDLLEANA
jgi:uncharacterized protein with von Willebrand factor type A (vWA) domain